MKKRARFFKNNTTGFGTTNINYSGYGYGKQYAGMVNIYGYDNTGQEFNYIVTYHRSKTIKKMLKTGEWWAINEDVRSNYSTNGYTTRIGIKRANIERCKQLAKSHKAIPFQGKSAHDYRVMMRN